MGGAQVVFALCLCARGGWCVVYSSPSLLYPFPPLASGALLACSRSCGSSVGGGLRQSCFPYLVVLLVLALGCPLWWCVAPSVLLCMCVLLPLLSSFLSLHTSLLLRGVSYCVYVFDCITYLALLVVACMCEYGHTFRSLCWRAGVGMFSRLHHSGYPFWRGYCCAFLACVAWCGM